MANYWCAEIVLNLNKERVREEEEGGGERKRERGRNEREREGQKERKKEREKEREREREREREFLMEKKFPDQRTSIFSAHQRIASDTSIYSIDTSFFLSTPPPISAHQLISSAQRVMYFSQHTSVLPATPVFISAAPA